MKSILFILLLFQVSLYAQNVDKKAASPAAPYTSFNGKILEVNKMIREKSNESESDFKLTKKEIAEGTVTLQAEKKGDAVPAIKSLEVYIPGYPAILIEGNKFDEATIEKIKNTKAGNVMVVSPQVENGKRPSILAIEILD